MKFLVKFLVKSMLRAERSEARSDDNRVSGFFALAGERSEPAINYTSEASAIFAPAGDFVYYFFAPF